MRLYIYLIAARACLFIGIDYAYLFFHQITRACYRTRRWAVERYDTRYDARRCIATRRCDAVLLPRYCNIYIANAKLQIQI